MKVRTDLLEKAAIVGLQRCKAAEAPLTAL
jgi:hypothetical protein